MKKTKNFIYYSIIIFFFIIFIELCSLLSLNYFKVKEIFNVRDFTEILDNKKITLKKNYKVDYPKENWSVITSLKRTRISKDEIDLNKIDNQNTSKILFIGDSVPFGWGVDAENSLPNIFDKLNDGLISVNGAIPSFEIKQSVDRLRLEFKDILNVKYIYFQIYDPVSQYSSLGARWKPGDNWTNSDKLLLREIEDSFPNINIAFYGEPNIYALIKKIALKKHFKFPWTTKDNDPNLESDENYKNYIRSQLRNLLEISNSMKAKLILAPVTINPKFIKEFSINHLKAINMLNKIFKDFSKKNDLIYFDTVLILSDISEDNFIDACCHLSSKGANKLAQELNKIIK